MFDLGFKGEKVTRLSGARAERMKMAETELSREEGRWLEARFHWV